MVKVNFNEEYLGFSYLKLEWKDLVDIFDEIWGKKMHSLPRYPTIIGGVSAGWAKDDGTKIEAEKLEELKKALNDERVNTITISSEIGQDPDVYFSYSPKEKKIHFNITSKKSEVISPTISTIKKYFPITNTKKKSLKTKSNAVLSLIWKYKIFIIILIILILLIKGVYPDEVNLGIFKYNLKNYTNEYSTKQNNSSKLPTVSQATPNQIRALEPLETGKKISELPNGVYFFGLPLSIKYEIEDPKDDFLEVTTTRLSWYSFEIQKINNRYYLIGYVSDEIYSKIGSVNSSNHLSTTIYPKSWGDAKHVISIPFDSVIMIKDRTIDLDSQTKMGVIDIEFKEVIDNPIVHEK